MYWDIFGALLSWSRTKCSVCCMCLREYSAKLEFPFWLLNFYHNNERVLLCDAFRQCFISATAYFRPGSLTVCAMCSTVFRLIFNPTRGLWGIWGILDSLHKQYCRSDFPVTSCCQPEILETCTLLQWPSSSLLILCVPSSIHPPEPRLCPAFPVNRLLGEEGCPLGWTLPPQGWPGNDPRVPGTRIHWWDTPCPPPQHTAHGQHPVQQCAQDGSLITPNANITMGGDAVWEAITEPFHHSEQVHGVNMMPMGKLQTTFLQTSATFFWTYT